MKLFSYPSKKYLAVAPTLFWLFFLLAFFISKKQTLKKISALKIRTYPTILNSSLSFF